MGIRNVVLNCGCLMYESTCCKRCETHTPCDGDVISYNLKLFLLTYGEKYDKNKKYIIEGVVVKAPFIRKDNESINKLIMIKTRYSFDVKLNQICFAERKCKFIEDGFVLLELDYVDNLVVTT